MQEDILTFHQNYHAKLVFDLVSYSFHPKLSTGKRLVVSTYKQCHYQTQSI